MLTHGVRDGWWWYGSRGIIFPHIFHYILLPYDRWQQRGTDKIASDMEVHTKQRCVTAFLHVEKSCTQQRSSVLTEYLWRPIGGCEHSEAVGGACQQRQQWHERQAMFQTTHADFYRCGMQAIVHLRQKHMAKSGGYFEKQYFVAENLLK